MRITSRSKQTNGHLKDFKRANKVVTTIRSASELRSDTQESKSSGREQGRISCIYAFSGSSTASLSYLHCRQQFVQLLVITYGQLQVSENHPIWFERQCFKVQYSKNYLTQFQLLKKFSTLHMILNEVDKFLKNTRDSPS